MMQKGPRIDVPCGSQFDVVAKRAGSYSRFSPDDTGEGRSNKRQRDGCMKLAQLRGCPVVRGEEEAMKSSGSRLDSNEPPAVRHLWPALNERLASVR